MNLVSGLSPRIRRPILVKTSIFTKLLILLCIAIFAISVTAVSAYAAEEEKTPEAAKTLQAAQAPQQKSRLIDINPAARVNGVAISRAKLDKGYNSRIQQKGMDTGMITNPRRYKKVQQEVLDGLITRELLWQAAQKKNFIAKDEDVQKTLSSVKSRFPSEDDFKLRLAQSDLTESEYAEFLRRQLSVKELVQKDIAQGISVSDDEIHRYYESNPEQFKAPEHVRARHILLKVERRADQAAREEAKKKIEGILNAAKSGADFTELAKKHSEGPSGPKGGDLGFFSRDQMVKPFAEAAFALNPGEISGVVQTIYGYHIIKVEEKKEPQIVAEKDVQEQIRQYLYSGKVQGAVQERTNILRAESNVEILLR
jgi:peptidyl-prolyl cis-trans isomerase C